MFIVKDIQGSPNDSSGVQRMDIKDNPAQDDQPSANMEDVHMETFDMGGNDDDTKPMQ